MGCDLSWADCLKQDLQDFGGIFGMGGALRTDEWPGGCLTVVCTVIFGIMGMGCDLRWADCLKQDLQDWGDFQDGRGAANRCVFGRVFDRCLNCDFWDIGDGL